MRHSIPTFSLFHSVLILLFFSFNRGTLTFWGSFYSWRIRELTSVCMVTWHNWTHPLKRQGGASRKKNVMSNCRQTHTISENICLQRGESCTEYKSTKCFRVMILHQFASPGKEFSHIHLEKFQPASISTSRKMTRPISIQYRERGGIYSLEMTETRSCC